jgi:hypothetical protein
MSVFLEMARCIRMDGDVLQKPLQRAPSIFIFDINSQHIFIYLFALKAKEKNSNTTIKEKTRRALLF